MPNARVLRLEPNATYISLTCKFENLLHLTQVISSVFRYQQVGIGNAKLPNATGFASQWNIGFTRSYNIVEVIQKTHGDVL